MAFWNQAAPEILSAVEGLLTDVYNFQAVGDRPMVTRAIQLKDGRTFRLYGSLQ
jgi:hypothetical protein